MIRKTVATLVLLPLALAIVVLAVANRAPVTVALDPFAPDRPAVAIHPPLYLLVLTVLIAGVIIGGVAAWLRQGRARRAARRTEAEARALREENAALKRRLEEPEGTPSVRAIAYRHPPAA